MEGGGGEGGAAERVTIYLCGDIVYEGPGKAFGSPGSFFEMGTFFQLLPPGLLAEWVSLLV